MKPRNIKSLLTLAATMLVALAATAQQTTSKEINKIKRSTSYLYAEATMESEQEAREVAGELLLQQIDEYIGSKKKLSRAANVVVKDIASKSETLTMMRGEMHRVFIYVKKSDIEGAENVTTLTYEPVAAQPQPIEEGVAIDVEPASTPNSETPAPIIERAESDLGAWQQAAINQLIDCGNLTAVRAKLNRLKAEYKVKRFGTAESCPSRVGAFWAIFDDGGTLLALLGPGSSKRVEYKTMQYSSLDAYKGKNAIWFTLAK